MTHTALATPGQIAWRLLEIHGIEAEAIFRKHGLKQELLRDPRARVPTHKWDAIARDAAVLLRDPAIILETADCWHPSNLGALGFYWLSCTSLRAGLVCLARYWRLITDKTTVKLADTPHGLRLAYDCRRSDPVLAAIFANFTVSLLVSMCRMNYGDGFVPVEVALKQAEPRSGDAYRAHFGCPVRFEAGEDSFTLAHADADLLLPTANRQVGETFDQIMNEQLAELDKADILARCKSVLLKQLAAGELSEQQMADRLHMSRRTLQRKLADANTTYQRLVDDTRLKLALRYVGEARHSITDITFILGFSQQSAFTRAFRRWTGCTPSQYRQQRALPA